MKKIVFALMLALAMLVPFVPASASSGEDRAVRVQKKDPTFPYVKNNCVFKREPASANYRYRTCIVAHYRKQNDGTGVFVERLDFNVRVVNDNGDIMGCIPFIDHYPVITTKNVRMFDTDSNALVYSNPDYPNISDCSETDWVDIRGADTGKSSFVYNGVVNASFPGEHFDEQVTIVLD